MFKWRTEYFQLVSIYMGAMLYMLKLLLNFGNQEALLFTTSVNISSFFEKSD